MLIYDSKIAYGMYVQNAMRKSFDKIIKEQQSLKMYFETIII